MSHEHEIPFKIVAPIEVFLKKGNEGELQRRVGGIISTEHRDRQGEIVLQRGLNFDDFLKTGWINDNHSRETTGAIGYPLKVKRTTHKGKPATYMEGYLLRDYEDADKIWKLAQSLQKTDRRLGWSIEGKVRRRAGANGKTIARADVTNVAVTNCPVNTSTGMDILAKSLMAMDHVDRDVDCCGACETCSARDVHKALMAGQATAAPAETVPGDGFALRTEALEGTPKDTAGRKKRKKRKKKRLSKAEALQAIRGRFPGITPGTVERIWQHAKGAETWTSR